MRLAFIAAPYRASTHDGVKKNIRLAESVAEEYWKKGYAVICPHLNSCFMSGIIDEQEFLDGYLTILKKCDVCIMVGDWRNSEGASIEYEQAKYIGVDILIHKSGRLDAGM